ncbi:E3 ubiquitin- ligase MIB2-like, partial [Brachionus plicatilis]
NKNFCSPLHVAVNKLFPQCVRALVNHNCDINIQDSYGDTPSHDIMGKPMSKESVEIFEILVSRADLDINVINKRGFNLFHQACLKGNHFFTEKLLKKFPDLINCQKNDGYSGLHLASLNGHKKTVEYLVKAKADLEMRTNRHQTPLLLAIAKLNSPIIELLVENYANVNSYDEDMETGLHLVLNEASVEKRSSPVKIKLSELDKALDSLSECKIMSQFVNFFLLKLILAKKLVIRMCFILDSKMLKKSKNSFWQKQTDFQISALGEKKVVSFAENGGI